MQCILWMEIVLCKDNKTVDTDRYTDIYPFGARNSEIFKSNIVDFHIIIWTKKH